MLSRRVGVNAAVLAALRAGAPLASLLLVLALSRRLGADGLGRYSLAYAWLGLFGLLGPLGLPALITREGARDREALGRLLAGGMILGGCLSLILTLAMIAAAGLLGYDAETRAAMVVTSLALAPATWLSYFDAALLAMERSGPIAAGALAEHVLKVGLGLALLGAGLGLEAVLAAAVAGKLAASGLSLWWLRRLGVRVAFPADWACLRRLAGQTPVFALSSICATLYWRIDVFLLSRLRGMAEVGCYTAAYRVLEMAILPSQALSQAALPRLASQAAQASLPVPPAPLGWLAVLTAPAALGVTALAGPLLQALYGEGFAAAAPALAILIWTALPYGWYRYQAAVLVAAGRQRVDLGINAALLVLNVGLNIVLIPRYGAAGAAAVTLVTALVYGAAQRICLRGRPCLLPIPC